MSKLEPTRTYSNPTATDVLRRMLDERGVEWWEATPCKTKWNSPIIGGPVAAREWNGEMVLDTGYIAVTPAQAIAATLGTTDANPTQVESSRTCQQEEGGWSTEGDHARVWLTCGHDCMVETVADLPNFCPVCGAKVVDE